MLNQFFVSELPTTGQLIIDGDEGFHGVKVLRLKKGELVRVSDGAGAWAEAEITTTTKNSFICIINNHGYSKPNRTSFTVVQALPKSERTKETIELLTEGGATTIIPWQASRSIAKWKTDSQSKWQVLARESSKQSRRDFIPKIANLVDITQINLALKSADKVLVFHENATSSITEVIAENIGEEISEVVLIIGPEGGITDFELAELKNGGAIAVKMGVPVFRSAHAGVAALAALQTGLRLW